MIDLRVKGTVGYFSIDAAFQGGMGATGLYGVSGAGKSTILRAIAGLWKPSEGYIAIGDDVLFDSASSINVPVEKRNLAAVFQSPLLFPHLTVEKNLAYGMKTSRKGDSSLWDDVVSMLELAPLLKRMPRNLSGGEAQRVALGRALLSRPKLLLLDEPLTGLDDKRREQVLPFLERLRDESEVPTVYVSHNRDEIIRLADLIFLVEAGSVTEEFTPGEFEDFSRRPIVRRGHG